MNFYGLNWYATPAFVTVVSGVIILYLARRGPRSYLAQLYRVLVVMMAAHNFDQLVLFVFANNSLPGTLEVDLIYYSLSVFTAAVLAHLSLALSTDFENYRHHRIYALLLYAPALFVLPPLWFSKWMVSGYIATGGVMPGVAFNSLHGPGFSYLVGPILMYPAIALAMLLAGTRSSNKQRRMRCYMVLLSSIPVFIFASAGIMQVLRVFPMNQYLNVTFAGPTAFFFFLLGTGYAIYRHRLLDIEFYIPWSQERRIKRAFYKRIQIVSERMPRLQGPEDAMQHISEVLRCPVVVRAKNETIMTPSPVSRLMASIPMEPFAKFDKIVAVDEVAYIDPALADLMRKHKVFAAVPIPQGAGPDSVVTWVFLGEVLSETVYSSRDFAMIGLLFQRMEIVFINQIGDVRKEMGEIRECLLILQNTCNILEQQVEELAKNRPVENLGTTKGKVPVLTSSRETRSFKEG